MQRNVDPVSYIEITFGIFLKRVGRDEYAGACPWCGGNDRFRLWRDAGNYWCRPGPGHCGQKGWIDELTGEKLTETERRLLKVESEQRRQQQEIEDAKHRLIALEQMHKCTDHLRYHENLSPGALHYWLTEGMTQETIDKYQLGFCEQCPTDHERRHSYTIPIINRGLLENIRHRLAGATGDKYRPHRAGLGLSLFNVDLLDQAADRILIVEGEKKSIISAQSGFPNVGITGKRAFRKEWLKWFDRVPHIFVALDPDARKSAEKLAGIFHGRGRVVDLPFKIDDMIVRAGAGADDIEGFLSMARRVTPNDKNVSH